MNAQDKQIALVYSIEGENFPMGEANDALAQNYVGLTVKCIAETLKQLGYRVLELPLQSSLELFKQQLHNLSPRETFVFNLVDGYGGTGIGAAQVLRLIEELGFCHTGAPATAIEMCTNKALAKQRLIDCGVPTPAFQVFEQPEGEVRVNYPLIVKPLNEDASLGIDFTSVVTNPTDLYQRIDYIQEHYHQPSLVEAFIPGREFAVSMWGNTEIEVLPISEEDYSNILDPLKRLLVYESKWMPESWYYQNIILRSPAALSSAEKKIIERTSIAAYRAIGLRDLGRVDIRYDGKTPYIIDINDIPDLTRESGFPHSAEVGGYSYSAMVAKILEIAFKREGWL